MRPYPFQLVAVNERPNVPEQLCQLVAAYEPFVVRGMAERWPLHAQLANAEGLGARIQRLETLLSDTPIRFTYTEPDQAGDIGIGPDLTANFRMDDRVTSAHEFLATVAELIDTPTGACAYAAALPLSDLPIETQDVPPPDAIGGARRRQHNLWIGSGNHVVDLHFDMMRNFIAMLAGHKRITLFPPEALPHIYPAPLHRRVAGVTRSLVKLLDWDEARYPDFGRALALAQTVTLEPGDVLHVPPLWWHHVESYGFNVMANTWYDDLPENGFVAANAMFRQNLARAVRMSPRRRAGWAREFRNAFDAGEAQSRNIDKARRITQALAPYWRQYLRLLHEVYVFQDHGDPYPTLPGMLTEVAQNIAPSLPRRVHNRLARVLRGNTR